MQRVENIEGAIRDSIVRYDLLAIDFLNTTLGPSARTLSPVNMRRKKGGKVPRIMYGQPPLLLSPRDD